MTTQTKVPASANLSTTLMGFTIPRRFKTLLIQFDKMHAYMKLANKSPPCLRFKRADFNDLNLIVRQQSQGKRNLGELTYAGLPILSTGDEG